MITYLAYIALGFAGIQFINAFINLVFLQRIRHSEAPVNDLVSVLIPARNEENNIRILLKCLQEISYKHLEILVFNDQSTDKTASIVKEFAIQDNRIRLIESEGLEKGWLGKNYACHFLASEAKGDYYLFMDADVQIEKSIIEESVNRCKKYQLGLLSAFPKQIIQSLGEKITVPLMNYILLTLLPLIFIRVSPFTSHSAANGQFMLFLASVYKKMKPHEEFKSSPVEDIRISRYLKRNKIKVACILGDNRITCRMYHGFHEATHGFAKNTLMFFGNSSVLAILFWAFTTLGFIPVLFVNLDLLICYITTILMTRMIVSLISKQNLLENVLFIIPQQFVLIYIISKAIQLKRKQDYIWKGRKIYSS